MNPSNFFLNPQQMADVREDQYWPKPPAIVGDNLASQAYTDERGNPIQMPEQQIYAGLQVVSIDQGTEGIPVIQDDNGDYWCRYLDPQRFATQDSVDDATILMKLDSEGEELVEGQFCLGVYVGTGLGGYRRLKMVVPGNVQTEELFDVTLTTREDYSDDPDNPTYQYGWTFPDDSEGGVLQARVEVTQTQTADGLNPDIFTIEVIGATGAGYRLIDDLVSTDSIPFDSDAAAIEAELTDFTVTGTYPSFEATGIDALEHTLTANSAFLEPTVSTHPARFLNLSTPMCVPVNIWLKVTNETTDGTDPTPVYKTAWSNGNGCCGVLGGIDVKELPDYPGTPTPEIVLTPSGSSVGPWTLVITNGDTGTYQITVLDESNPTAGTTVYDNAAGACPELGSDFVVTVNEDCSCNIAGDGETSYELLAYGAKLRAYPPEPFLRVGADGCFKFDAPVRCTPTCG